MTIPGIFSKLSRPWGRDVYSTQGAGTVANPYNLVKNTRISNTSFGGKILSGPLANQNFSTNGVLVPFVNGTPTGASTIQSGGDGAFFNKASLKTQLKNTQFFGRADYELTDNINAWVQGSYVDTNNKNNHQNNEFRNYTLSAMNAFLRPEYQQAMAAAGVNTLHDRQDDERRLRRCSRRRSSRPPSSAAASTASSTRSAAIGRGTYPA